MNRDSKRIKSTIRPDVDRVKSFILSSNNPFDGTGNIFKTALKELRARGLNIKYVPEKCHYVKL